MSTAVMGLVASVLPALVSTRHIKNIPLAPHIAARQAESRPISYDAYYFDQKIDHFPTSDRYLPHTNDTFKQTYYFDTSYYKPGMCGLSFFPSFVFLARLTLDPF
jgi:hypothetical protein